MVLAGMMGTAIVVFSLGVLNRYGINPLRMEILNGHFISTIGNINWYCGYWSVIVPIGAGLFVFCENKLVRILSGLFVTASYTTCVTQGSDSGVLCLAVLTLLMGYLVAEKRTCILRFLEMLLIFCGATLILTIIRYLFPYRNQYITPSFDLLTKTVFPYIATGLTLAAYLVLLSAREGQKIQIIFEKILKGMLYLFFAVIGIIGVLVVVNTKNPGSIGALSEWSLFTFNEDWASKRGATWTFGMQTWRSQNLLHRLIGVGPDGMAAYIYSGLDAQLLADVKAVFGSSRLTNAHGEWITVLADLGVFGLIGFAGMMVSAIIRFFKAGKDNVLCLVCGLSLFAYTIHNIFSFQQIMNIPLMFIVMGVGEYLVRRREDV